MSRVLLVCSWAWGRVNAAGAAVRAAGEAIEKFGAARMRGCQQRMRRAVGLPPLPEIPADPAE